MSVITTKGKYHLALDGNGLLLQGSPTHQAYKSERATVYGQRFASGDRDYNDFSQWWYFIQTDWSGGVKEASSWLDDAKFYYSSNIDVSSKIGSLKLLRQSSFLHSFDESVVCGLQTAINPTISDTGFKVPTTNKQKPGSIGAWTNPANAYASDNSYATGSGAVYQNYGGFGFSIPTGATIKGIEVSVEAKKSGGSAPKIYLAITKDGDAASGYGAYTATLTDSDALYNLGGPVSLWGSTFTPAEINNATFGVSSVQGNESPGVDFYIDQIRIKVYYEIPAVATRVYVGTYLNSGTSKPIVYSYDGSSWTDISSGTIDITTRTAISQLSIPFGVLLFSTIGTGTTFFFNTYNGASIIDQSGFIAAGAGLTIGATSSRCHAAVGGYLYVFVDNEVSGGWAIVKTANAYPSANGDWTKVLEKTSVQEFPVDAIDYYGDLFYIVRQGSQTQLRMWNVADGVDTLINTFKNCSLNNYGMGGKLLSILNGKLVITIPTKEIWEYDGSELRRIYKVEPEKTLIGAEATPQLSFGCVVSDNKLYWGNLIYDGNNFYNGFKDYYESNMSSVYPLFVDTNDDIYFKNNVNECDLFIVDTDGTSYKKGASNSAFLIFSNYDKLQSIDKLLNSVVVSFDKLLTEQSINVYYTDNPSPTATISDWTLLGTASYTSDGGTVVSKTMLFPVGTIVKKLWFRVELVSTTAGTPAFNDLTLEYLPLPDYKKQWTFYVDCSDNLKRLDGQLVDKTARELKSILERLFWTKSSLDFQDLDYAATTLNENPLTYNDGTISVLSTVDFPEQGRIKIENEEILYAGKTPSTFTGCIRGARGTKAVAHNTGSTVDNSYKVLFVDVTIAAPILLKDKELEYTLGMTLREV